MPRRRTATIDASCLIALYHLEILDKLHLLFERVHIPRRVMEEVSKRRNQKRRVKAALRKFAVYRRCEVGNPDRIEILLQDRKRTPDKPKADLGEAEAVIQATEIEAEVVIVDDPGGRDWAIGHRLECCGMLWVLRELRRIEVISRLRPALGLLQRKGYRLPKQGIIDLLLEFDEL